MYDLKISDVSKKFGDVNALRDINLDVEENELFGVIGPDGSGKTTLFRIAATLLVQDTGKVKLSGLDNIKDYKKIREIIGYMPGRFSLYPDLTVEENLKFYATVFGTTVKENYDIIKDVYLHLEPFKKRRAGKLSGGMKQKLALCCALVHKPKFLILDEPTTGVDPVSRNEFWEILRNLKSIGMTVIVSTPYMDEAKLCDRVTLMQNGCILSVQTPAEIIEGFGKKIFSIRTDALTDTLKFLNEYKYTENVFLYGDVIHYIDIRKEIKVDILTQYLRTNELKNITIKEIEPSVEDCFLTLMREK
ncbi:MAG: ABC transporter ATP-binding protein [Ignavibacteria bacterium]|nr:ABC transporter ATP-binding protein [Ignavibacteria bacterium]